ncbi:hypothetical protein ACFFJT_16925 [Dyella flava]|uniref:DUF7931 domain-containing protein n=1 Tax=Dyella flava TaxID=1920170 RepID=A0ABS2K3H5_9GAMM|nr:hypothetical protein [Dyella flava]MBM7125790.1 hypothetical protein [Dyella flava]GLQ48692.1 hypothetical protein GCM10010872_01410 [Dyella flava]
MSTTPTIDDESPRAVDGREDMAAVRLQLLVATRYKLAIYLPALSPDILSSPTELAELRRIATSGRGAEIRIILGDPATALRAGHRLIDLAQRLPTALQIRTPADEDIGETRNSSAWILNDGYGYLFLPNADRPEGRAALRDGPGQAPLLLEFERLWERALPATQLQPLGL